MEHMHLGHEMTQLQL